MYVQSNKESLAYTHNTIKQRLEEKKINPIYRPYVDNVVDIDLIVEVKSVDFHNPDD